MRRTDFRISGLLGALVSVAALASVAGCGSTSTAAAPSPAPNIASPVAPSPTPDAVAAGAAAVTIFYAVPGQNPEIWAPCSQQGADFSSCPFADSVKTRWRVLSSAYYFADGPPGRCGEDYITGTQNGLFTAPKMLSSVANTDGTVTVVIRRGPPPPDFTVTMTYAGGAWLATDLASGTGPSASVFSATPNC